MCSADIPRDTDQYKPVPQDLCVCGGGGPSSPASGGAAMGGGGGWITRITVYCIFIEHIQIKMDGPPLRGVRTPV